MAVDRSVDRSVERIELIDADDTAIWIRSSDTNGGAETTGTPQPDPGRRSAAKVIAVVAVLGIAVAFGASLGDASPSRSRQPVTGAPVTGTASPAVSPTTASPAAPRRTASPSTGPSRFRLVSDPPPGFAAGPAAESEPGSNTDAASIDGAGVTMLWSAGPEATPGSRWFLVTVMPGRMLGDSVGEVRLATAAGVALATRTPRGFLRFSGPVRGGSAEIVAAGVEPEALVEVLDGLSLEGGRLFLDDTAIPAGLQLRSSSQGRGPARWSPVIATTVTYPSVAGSSVEGSAIANPSVGGTSAGATPRITVASGSRPTDFQQVVEWFFLVGSQRVDVDGEIALIGTNPLTGERALTFDRAGVHVVVSAAVDRPDDDPRIDDAIGQVASTLRQAGNAEWDARQSLSAPIESAPGSGPDGAVRIHHPPGATEVYGFDLQPAGTNEVDGSNGGLGRQASEPSIRWSASSNGAAVIAVLPPGVVGAVLRVSIGDVTKEAALTGAGQSAEIVGLVEFTEPGLFTARIVAADGTVLAAASPLSERSAARP